MRGRSDRRSGLFAANIDKWASSSAGWSALMLHIVVTPISGGPSKKVQNSAYPFGGMKLSLITSTS